MVCQLLLKKDKNGMWYGAEKASYVRRVSEIRVEERLLKKNREKPG